MHFSKYLNESILKNYNYSDDILEVPADVDDLINVLNDYKNSYSVWNFADAEIYAKKAIKLLDSVKKDIKKDLKELYKSEKNK
jgi:lipoprotein signal peptidase